MTTGQVWMLYGALVASVFTVVMILELVLIGQPPRHCHYLVPVKAKPGIYACSEYPRPLPKP